MRLRNIAIAKTIMSHCAQDADVTRLREIALARTMSHHARDTDVARLREILLTRTMSQDYCCNNKVSRICKGLCSQLRCRKTQRNCARKSNVVIVIFIVVVVAIVGPYHGNHKAQTLPLQRVCAQGFARERKCGPISGERPKSVRSQGKGGTNPVREVRRNAKYVTIPYLVFPTNSIYLFFKWLCLLTPKQNLQATPPVQIKMEQYTAAGGEKIEDQQRPRLHLCHTVQGGSIPDHNCHAYSHYS